jgi:hypothetical protein
MVALNDRCTHAASRLSSGRIRRGAIMCPLHGARFDLADGRCIGGAYPAVRQFDLRVVDGMVEIAVPARPPGMDETPVESERARLCNALGARRSARPYGRVKQKWESIHALYRPCRRPPCPARMLETYADAVTLRCAGMGRDMGR